MISMKIDIIDDWIYNSLDFNIELVLDIINIDGVVKSDWVREQRRPGGA